jgi:hypothetical protein
MSGYRVSDGHRSRRSATDRVATEYEIPSGRGRGRGRGSGSGSDSDSDSGSFSDSKQHQIRCGHGYRCRFPVTATGSATDQIATEYEIPRGSGRGSGSGSFSDSFSDSKRRRVRCGHGYRCRFPVTAPAPDDAASEKHDAVPGNRRSRDGQR